MGFYCVERASILKKEHPFYKILGDYDMHIWNIIWRCCNIVPLQRLLSAELITALLLGSSLQYLVQNLLCFIFSVLPIGLDVYGFVHCVSKNVPPLNCL